MHDPTDELEERLLDEPDDPMAIGCLFPNDCLMSGTHMKGECYTAEMAEAVERQIMSMPFDYVPTGSALDEVARCRVCGCTDLDGCPDGCVWATPDLCSRCVG